MPAAADGASSADGSAGPSVRSSVRAADLRRADAGADPSVGLADRAPAVVWRESSASQPQYGAAAGRILARPGSCCLRGVGVDEYATRQGRHYGTVLVDVEVRRPVDLLPDRKTPAWQFCSRSGPGWRSYAATGHRSSPKAPPPGRPRRCRSRTGGTSGTTAGHESGGEPGTPPRLRRHRTQASGLDLFLHSIETGCTDVCVIAATGHLTGRVLIGNGDGYWGPNVSSATDFLDWYERWLNHMSAGCDNRALELTSPRLHAHPNRHRKAPKI